MKSIFFLPNIHSMVVIYPAIWKRHSFRIKFRVCEVSVCRVEVEAWFYMSSDNFLGKVLRNTYIHIYTHSYSYIHTDYSYWAKLLDQSIY